MTIIQQALVFISAAVVLVPIFQRLGFGSVLGYLIAGMLVGPQGLKLIEDAQSVAHFSELGVVFLLFIIGIEIQPTKLWSMRKHLLGLGAGQVLFCTAAFSAIVYYIFNLPLLPTIIIGLALSLSSTAFAVQTLIEKNVFNTEFGRGSFATLLMQDLMAIPALAVIPFLMRANTANTAPAANTSSPIAWQSIAIALTVIVLLVLASRYLMRPVFRLIASTRSRDIFTAVTLFIVIGVGSLMQSVGLSAALGTFIAGVLLADSEYRHELEANLEPFKGLLMGLFFIAVGMSVSLDLISQKPMQIFSLALGYLALKIMLIYFTGRLNKMNHDNSKRMALNIAQGGEFAFVIFGILAALQLNEHETLAKLTAVITLSMALNPVVIFADERICQSRRKNLNPKYDEIKNEDPEIIIAGLGRFGQIFSRILRAQNTPFVAIDHDADQIELLRKFGTTVYFGDASRLDLLETAGASKAKYFILAIDDVETSLRTAELVRQHYPNLKIFARARNRGHAFDLIDLGVVHIKRELLDSSVDFVRELLVEMGHDQQKAKQLVERFKKHDELMLLEQHKVRTDDKSLIDLSKQASLQLAQVLSEDSRQSHIH